MSREIFAAVWKRGIAGTALAAVLLTGCFEQPPYPYRDFNEIEAEADTISTRLDAYIDAWFAGDVGAIIPDSLIPVGFDTSFGRTYRLIPYDQINPRQHLMIRKAHTINRDSLFHSFPDPNCTYIGDLKTILPFGHRVIVEGEFPYSRFFDIQFTPSFDPAVYHYGYGGEGEVPFCDVDIDPLSGHVNPFRPGANRMATNRTYRIEATAAKGNSWDRNKASQPPYRQATNHRYISGIVYQGPWGDSAWTNNHSSFGHGNDQFDCGQLWIRYYLPDSGTGWNAGVSLPRVWYETPEGNRYYIEKNIENAQLHINQTFKASTAWPDDPKPIHGSTIGWYKQFDIFLVGLEGIAQYHNTWTKEEVRDLFTGITGRGEGLPKTRGSEPHKTGCTYINYLVRGMSLGHKKVAVLTGTLPTFPDTYHGASTMERAQMRYWSLTGYDNSKIMDGYSGMAVHCVRDDQLVLDSRRRFCIVLSRAADRPANATRANGITWVDWGPAAEYSWTLRWMSISPDWEFELSPDEHLLTWEETSWSGSQFNPGKIGTNNHSGTLGEYLPKVHYLSKADFEALGSDVPFSQIPEWEETSVRNGYPGRPRMNTHHTAAPVAGFDVMGKKQVLHTNLKILQTNRMNLVTSRFSALRLLIPVRE